MPTLRLKWSEAPYVVLDTETTGLSSTDRVCEITLAACQRGEVLHNFSAVVNPGCPISPDASSIHGITDADVKNAPLLRDLVAEVLNYLCMDVPWVAHNLAFDYRMITYDIDKARLPRGIPTLCTLDYSRHRHPSTRGLKRRRLVDVAEYFGLTPNSRLHSSFGDVELLARTVPRLMGDLVVGDTMTRWSQDW